MSVPRVMIQILLFTKWKDLTKGQARVYILISFATNRLISPYNLLTSGLIRTIDYLTYPLLRPKLFFLFVFVLLNQKLFRMYCCKASDRKSLFMISFITDCQAITVILTCSVELILKTCAKNVSGWKRTNELVTRLLNRSRLCFSSSMLN